MYLSLLSVLQDNYFLSSVTVFTYELPDNQVSFHDSELRHCTFRSSTGILVSTVFLYTFRDISLVYSAQRSKLLHQTTESHLQNPFKNSRRASYHSVSSQKADRLFSKTKRLSTVTLHFTIRP